MHILFYDLSTPVAYSDKTLKTEVLRGTEATVIRVAQALKNHHQISVAQHCRQPGDDCHGDGVNYFSLASAHDLDPDIVVLLRQQEAVTDIVHRFPRAQHYLWMHNLPPRDLYRKKEFMQQHNVQVIAVSHFHRRTIERRLMGKWYQRLFSRAYATAVPVHVVYNPVDDALHPDGTTRKKNQMIFSSSLNKGFELVAKMFNQVLETFPDYELLIASPDKFTKQVELPPRVRFLGPLPHHELIQHIRESALVFYPQWERVETFGLVYAEANAVGTPVLAHDFGAASEILSNADQLINGRDMKAITDKLAQWRKQSPHITMKPAFRLCHVAQSWLDLFAQHGAIQARIPQNDLSIHARKTFLNAPHSLIHTFPPGT
jgi:glycosyltransferase involved in cell wall biosynthesis